MTSFQDIFKFSYGETSSSRVNGSVNGSVKSSFRSIFLDVDDDPSSSPVKKPPLPLPVSEDVSYDDVFRFDYTTETLSAAEQCEEALGAANLQIAELLDILEKVALAKA